MHKCIICDKKATKRFSPDLDIRGLGSCDKHENDVQFGYVMLMQGDDKMFEAWLKGMRKAYEKSKRKNKQ